MLREFQRDFIRTVLSPDRPATVDAFLLAPTPAETGMAVHRNTVFSQLTAALGDLFPVVKELVGDGFFAFAVRQFVRAHPPATPVLGDYGDAFPDFLDAFEPARPVPYLGNVARLGLARHQSLNAADEDPVAAGAFGVVPAESLCDLKLRLHPAVRFVQSVFPVDAIWEAHQGKNRLDRGWSIPDRPAYLLIARPFATLRTLDVSPAALAFVECLRAGDTLTIAARHLDSSFALQALLTELLAIGAFAGFALAEDIPC